MTQLSISDLTVRDPTGRIVVDRLSLDVGAGRVIALVGEPGAGAVLAGLALLDAAPEHDVKGEVRVGDDELLVLQPDQRRRVRGSRMGALFPDPREAFDPGLTLYENLAEVVVHGAGRTRSEARDLIVEELTAAGVPTPTLTMYRRAGQLPRGILQRACVALAAACRSQVVVAESPSAMLDVLAAADVHELLRGLADERGVGVLLITEDIARAAAIADEIVLMYAGEVHEGGSAEQLLSDPRGPYTRALLDSAPRLDRPRRDDRATRGRRPSEPTALTGCRFAERCPFTERLCRRQHPDLRTTDRLRTRCHFADEATWLDRLEAFHGRSP